MGSLPDDEIKEILHHAMSNSWKKQMTLQGYNYLNGSDSVMADFFETRIENLEPMVETKTFKGKKKHTKTSKKHFAESSDEDASSDDTKCKKKLWDCMSYTAVGSAIHINKKVTY